MINYRIGGEHAETSEPRITHTHTHTNTHAHGQRQTHTRIHTQAHTQTTRALARTDSHPLTRSFPSVGRPIEAVVSS